MVKALKKYRVKTIDNEVKIVLAKNIHDAMSKARLEVGQLPNDVNLKVVSNALTLLQDKINSLKEISDLIKVNSKDYNWDSIYEQLKSLQNDFTNDADTINDLAGSMVKINKEEK